MHAHIISYALSSKFASVLCCLVFCFAVNVNLYIFNAYDWKKLFHIARLHAELFTTQIIKLDSVCLTGFYMRIELLMCIPG